MTTLQSLNLHLSWLLMTQTSNSCFGRNEPISKVVILDDFAFLSFVIKLSRFRSLIDLEICILVKFSQYLSLN